MPGVWPSGTECGRVPRFARLESPLPLPPMEAKLVDALPEGEGWQFEPKWDGFRCLVFRDGDEVALQSKAGRPLGRYLPGSRRRWSRRCRRTASCSTASWSSRSAASLSFEALQMRLHPAESRVRKLAARDAGAADAVRLPRAGGDDAARRAAGRAPRGARGLPRPAPAAPDLLLSPCTLDRAVAVSWLERAGGALDGVVAKRRDEPYRPGERAMLKVKQLRTADCVVGGFRYAAKERQVGSLLLGLYDDAGLLHHVGFTSSIPAAEKAALTERLEALIEPPGFTGNAPGGPSRWSTGRSAEWQPLRPELVAEVRYDHVTGEPLPPRHQVPALAAGQGARAMPDGPLRRSRPLGSVRPESRASGGRISRASLFGRVGSQRDRDAIGTSTMTALLGMTSLGSDATDDFMATSSAQPARPPRSYQGR